MILGCYVLKGVLLSKSLVFRVDSTHDVMNFAGYHARHV